MVTQVETKVCRRCHREKPIEQYNKNPNMAAGRLHQCKNCVSDANRYRLLICGDAKRAADREWYREAYKKPEVRAKFYAHHKRRRRVHPDRERAISLVLSAIKYGRLTRMPCVICGDVRSHGHHEDYSKPLEVVWLCAHHHQQRHAELRALAKANSK